MISRVAQPSIFQFKAIIRDSQPPIWRRIHVHENLRLPKLHRVIQNIMKWEDCHLHEFRFGKLVYAIPDPEDQEFGRVVRDERKVALKQKWKRPGDCHQYCYDFGDNWSVDLLLESILMEEPGLEYPLCVDGAWNGPPEDCGGIHGYQKNYLPALADKKHPEHEELLSWKGPYDAVAFDKQGINAKLRKEFGKTKTARVFAMPAAPLGPDDLSVSLDGRERALILEHTFAPDELTKSLLVGRAVACKYRFSPEDLEDLAGFIAAEANHAKNKKLQKELDALHDKFEQALSGRAG